MKNKNLNQWLWKWHFIAGLISLPFVILLAVTGSIYLFKDTYEAPRQAHIKYIESGNNPLSYQKQWNIAKTALSKPPNAMVIPSEKNQATAFISGRFSHKNSLFINPFTAEVTGKISPKDSNMHTVRKLHGELLMGKFGTKIVELIASWMFVLIITGIYVFWPSKQQGVKAFFTIRFKKGKRILFRDLHTVLGFWISVVLLMTLAGGMPWTDVFGDNFKTLQKLTNTGFPKTWHGKGLTSSVGKTAVTLDEMVALAKKTGLEGRLHIGLPKNPKDVYIVYNESFNLSAQKRFYYDQYSGVQLLEHSWSDVGVLMRGRMWLMAFHQGQFGRWNWVLMLTLSLLLLIVALAALLSYFKRKENGSWGVPKVSKTYKIGYGVVALIIILGIIFPLFGCSVILITIVELLRKRKARTMP